MREPLRSRTRVRARLRVGLDNGRARSVKNRENKSEEVAAKKSLVNPETIVSLQEKICSSWEVHKIEKGFQDEFMKCFACLQPRQYIQTVSAEIKSLRDGSAPLQRLLASIQRREASIKDAKDLLSSDQADFTNEDTKEKVLSLQPH